MVALERWPRDGVPPNPAAWIALTARRKAIDRLRSEKRADRVVLERVERGARERDPRRAARADLRLLPPGARAGGRAWR